MSISSSRPRASVTTARDWPSSSASTTAAVDLLRAQALRALGRLDDAEATLRGAYELATSCGLASVTWRLRAELAAVFDAQGRAADAEMARAEALATVENLA